MATIGTDAQPAEQFDDLAQQRRANLMGMWVFLATELLLFGGVFTSYAVMRTLHADAFAQAATHLDLVLGSVNTAILLTSGLTMAMAETAVNAGRRRLGPALLWLTVALAVVFLGIKGYEWYSEASEGLMPLFGWAFEYPDPNPVAAKLFFNLYYILTGMHAIHMAIGVVLIAVVAALGARRVTEHATTRRRVQITGLYWAFVDAVWVVVFTVLYLLR